MEGIMLEVATAKGKPEVVATAAILEMGQEVMTVTMADQGLVVVAMLQQTCRLWCLSWMLRTLRSQSCCQALLWRSRANW